MSNTATIEKSKTEANENNLPLVQDNSSLSTFLRKVERIMIPLVPEMLNFVKPELKLGFEKINVIKERDAYYVQGGYALKLTKLNEIAVAAGIQISCGRNPEKFYDDAGRITNVKHYVQWTYRNIDGSTKRGEISGEYNYAEDIQKFTAKEDKLDDKGKVKLPKGEIDWNSVNQRRAKAGQLAESNAIYRAINKALPKLRGTYTAEELKKPFLVPCVIEDIADILAKHPELENEYLRKKLGLAGMLYADPQQVEKVKNEFRTSTPAPMFEEKPKAEKIEDAKVIEEKPKAAERKVEDPDEKLFPPGMVDKNERAKFYAEQFKDSPQEERTKVINDLIAKKKFERKNKATSIDTYSVAKQIEFIEMLWKLP
ncbi:MAG: hypothetical protein M0P61_00085 [Ignavibacteriaceae bacterium]|jgi:hypothetical protein|nr:hypothetical protein [Ignavibacteriaceae bacterium]